MYLSGAIWKRTNIDIMQCDRGEFTYFLQSKRFPILLFFFVEVNKDLFMSNKQKFGVMTSKIIIKPN